jgi:hypothetical protein
MVGEAGGRAGSIEIVGLCVVEKDLRVDAQLMCLLSSRGQH